MKKLYCGGTFCFDFVDPDYTTSAAMDYRVRILGSVEGLMRKRTDNFIKEEVEYIGPYYVETEDVPYGLNDEIIVGTELKMIEECTDAIFLLDDGCCPGTISELTLASVRGKRVAVFYIRRNEDEETESSLHTPCWFAIIMSRLLNDNTRLFSCADREDAVGKIVKYVSEL